MRNSPKMLTIHMCDDDHDDQLLFTDAMHEAKLSNAIDFTSNGKELLQYLKREAPYTHLKGHPLPGLILLDLNMPIMDGREALEKIKLDEKLRSIPIVVLTTSKAEEDIARSYQMGANSFIIKPVAFDNIIELVRSMTNYWFHIVALPES